MGAQILFHKRDGRLVLECSKCGEVGGELESDDARRRFVVPHIVSHREPPTGQREREVISRVQQNTELQRQIAASRAEKEAGGTPVPWRQVLAEKETRSDDPAR